MGFFGSRSNKSSSSGNVGPAGRKTDGSYGTAADARQASKRNKFRNQGAKDISKGVNTPSMAVNAVASLLSGPLQAGSRVNRDFFTDEVLGSKNFRGTTKSDFEKMSLTEQEKMYDNYMSGRQTGKTDAYGNTISQGGGGNGNQNQGIELAKNATGSATTTGPNEIQKSATNTVTTKDAKKNTTDTLLANKRKGRRTTNKTSATGLDDDYTLAKKKLLG